MSYLSNHLTPWIDPRVQSVRVAEMAAYLDQHGWRSTAAPRPQLLCFEGPLADDGEPLRLLLPSAECGSDYVELMIRAITNLALIEDRYAVEVLNDILNQRTGTAPVTNGQEDVSQSAPGAAAVGAP